MANSWSRKAIPINKFKIFQGACSSAISRWKNQYKAELAGYTPEKYNAITPDQQRIQLLEKQLKQSQRNNEILKKAESQYKVNELCRVFGISLSSYYYKPVTASLADINLMTLIQTAI